MYIRNGTPIREVTIPIGTMIPGITNFDTFDAVAINRTPNMADIGAKYLWSSPTSIRAKWGDTNPINPIVPTKDTAPAVSSALKQIHVVVVYLYQHLNSLLFPHPQTMLLTAMHNV